jgi:predicted secreted Zn-dependent protease
MSIELECDGTTSRAVISCYYNPNRSWTKSKDSDYLLAHEQLHFDITELFVRKLRKQLAEFGNDCEGLSKHIEDYYNRNYKEFVAYQDRYDRETKHSLNKEKQQFWEEKVSRELKELKSYASLASN